MGYKTLGLIRIHNDGETRVLTRYVLVEQMPSLVMAALENVKNLIWTTQFIREILRWGVAYLNEVSDDAAYDYVEANDDTLVMEIDVKTHTITVDDGNEVTTIQIGAGKIGKELDLEMVKNEFLSYTLDEKTIEAIYSRGYEQAMKDNKEEKDKVLC